MLTIWSRNINNSQQLLLQERSKLLATLGNRSDFDGVFSKFEIEKIDLTQAFLSLDSAAWLRRLASSAARNPRRSCSRRPQGICSDKDGGSGRSCAARGLIT